MIAALLAAALAAGGDDILAYEGLAYARRGDALLYREQHYVDGAQRLVVYRCADGAAFARKRVDAAASPFAPDFDLVDARLSYREGATRDGDVREVFVERGGARTATRLSPPADGVVDAGFDAYLRAHWDALARGEATTIPFLVPSEQRFLPFRVRRLDTDAARGETRFRLTLAAWYGFLAPAMDVTYDSATRELRRYAGLTPIRDAGGDNLDVRIEFPPGRARRGVNAADVEAARGEPLDGRCDLRQ